MVSRDPSGKVLMYGCDQARKEFEKYIELIRGTEDGKQLLDSLEKDTKVYKIMLNYYGENVQKGTEIYVDPTTHPLIQTTEGLQPASTLRILVHELGHAQGYDDIGPGKMDNIHAWENPIVGPIEGYNRTAY